MFPNAKDHRIINRIHRVLYNVKIRHFTFRVPTIRLLSKQFGTDFLGNMTSIRTFKRMLSHRKNTQLLISLTNSCGSYLKICENKTKWQAKLSTHCLYLAIKLNPKIFSHKQRICTTEYFQNPVSLRVWSSCVMILIRGKQCVLSRFVGTVMYIIPIIQIMLEGTWNFFPLFN